MNELSNSYQEALFDTNGILISIYIYTYFKSNLTAEMKCTSLIDKTIVLYIVLY